MTEVVLEDGCACNPSTVADCAWVGIVPAGCTENMYGLTKAVNCV